MIRTDLAVEAVSEKNIGGINIREEKIGAIPVSTVIIGAETAARVKKSAGQYITMTCTKRDVSGESEALSELLKKLLPKGKALIAGLGNEKITPDSLGARTVARVAATAHFVGTEEFKALGLRETVVVETGVIAQTGIESASQLKYLVEGEKPDFLLVIDSLSCGETDRLARTIQLTDTGIAPGSGVDNARGELSEKSLGIPVFAIGVPTVIDLKSLYKTKLDAMVTPRDIDGIINHFSRVISRAINLVFCPALSDSELEWLTEGQ